MLASLAALVAFAAAPVELAPTDDIWVYPHASDPQRDPFLRIWGAQGDAVAPSADDAGDYSYSYLKFDLKALPAGAVKSVKLVLTHVADPGWTEQNTKDYPLEIRALGTKFVEKGWSFEMSRELQPKGGKKGFYVQVAPKPVGGKPVPIEFDLWSSEDFRKDFEASRTGSIALAVVSSLDASVVGRQGIYKLYSKDDEKLERRPKLVVEIG